MQPFDYVVPADYSEASALLAGAKGAARAFQGGTDLLIRLRAGTDRPPILVDLKHLPGMTGIRRLQDGWLVIGAACTLNQVAASPLVAQEFDLLKQACTAVASYQLRNRATIGGNCCNASPAADTAPALYCLEAVLEIYGPDGPRRLPVSEFFIAPGRTALGRGEFLMSICLPPSPMRARGVLNKLGRTKIGDLAMVSIAAYAWTDAVTDEGVPDSGTWRWRIAMGAVGPTPLRAPEAEALLGSDRSTASVARAAEAAARACRPIDDIRASADYRRAMVSVLSRRAIEEVVSRMGEPR